MKICGFVSTSANQQTIKRNVQTMLQDMRHEPADTTMHLSFEGCGIAALKHPGIEQANCLTNNTADCGIALAGNIIARHDQSIDNHEPPHSERLLRELLDKAAAPLPQSNGDFAFARYDARTATLTLATSKYGFCPLYYAVTSDGCYFASEAKSVARAIGSVELDWHAVADFFYIGHMMGERTLFRGVKALGPGQVLEYRNGALDVRTYADFTHTPVMAREDVSLERIATLFTKAVEQRLQRDAPQVVMLSGGLDSRLIMGTLHQLGVKPRIISLEHDNIRKGADGRYATLMAQRLGLQCEVRPTRRDFYGSPHSVDVFAILDGVVPTWELFIGQIYPELDVQMGVVWDGLGLDLALGGTHQFQTTAQNMAYFLKKRPVARPLLQAALTPEAFQAADEGFLARVDAELQAIPASENQFLHFLLKHRIRRRIAVNPYQLFASRIEPSTPSTDREFLDYVVGIPKSLRLNHAAYAAMVKRYFPVLTEVPVISGGSPLYFEQGYAASLGRFVEQSRLSVVRVAKRFNLKKRVKHVANQPLTPREQDFARLIVATLERTDFDRPCYNRAHLREMFAAYRGGNILYHDLFTTVFYIELWHQLFVEHGTELQAAGTQTVLGAV